MSWGKITCVQFLEMEDLREKLDKLEKKVDLLTLAVERLERLMLEAQPFLKIVNNIPFIK